MDLSRPEDRPVLIVSVSKAGTTPLIAIRDSSTTSGRFHATANTTDVPTTLAAIEKWLVKAVARATGASSSP